jgi:hypothetical protein
MFTGPAAGPPIAPEGATPALTVKTLRWRSVTGGIVAVVSLVAIAVIVLTFARTGALRGKKFRLYVAVPDATGVLEGSDVWFNGQRIGTVGSIGFAQSSAPVEHRVIIATDVLERMRPDIRLDTRAALRSGGTVIGAPVIYLSGGSVNTRAVVAGDTLGGAGKSDFEIAASRVTESLEALPAIMSDVQVISTSARAAANHFSAAMKTSGGPAALGANFSRLMTRLSGGRGSASRLVHDATIRSRISGILATTDSIRVLAGSRANEFGRFRRDSSLGPRVDSLRVELVRLRALAAAPTGTAGRVRSDSALQRDVRSALAQVDSLLTDMKKHPLRYARVF